MSYNKMNNSAIQKIAPSTGTGPQQHPKSAEPMAVPSCRSLFLVFRLSLPFYLLLLASTACNSGPSLPDPGEGLAQQRMAISQQAAEGILLPELRDLAGHTDQLLTNVEAFQTQPDSLSLARLRASLEQTWTQWQSMAMFSFGPAETQTLRNSLNTFPTDTSKIVGNIESGNYVLGSLDNLSAMGFPALDYLLHGLRASDPELLQAYTTETGASARLAYLLALGEDMQDRIHGTLQGWEASGGNYLASFTATQAGGTDVGSALSLLVNAMEAHFQRAVRDGKVAIPAGIRSAGVPRPTATEAYYGGYSVGLLVASLEAYQRLYLGIGQTPAGFEDGEGLHDYLIALQADQLAEDIQMQFTEMLTLAKALEEPLSESIARDPQPAIDLFLEMQQLVILLKADMASLMGISITNQDNDGD